MPHHDIVNGFEVNTGGVVSVVNLDDIAVGPEKECCNVHLEKRDFLRVSKDFRIDSPCKSVPHMDEYVIAPLPFAYHKSGSVICFRASKCEEGEDLVLDMGITFEGDGKCEFGHYFLWNPENGELSISETLDWFDVVKTDLKRWESKLVPDGAVNGLGEQGEAEKILQAVLADCRRYTSDCRIDGQCVVAANKALPVYRNITSKYNTGMHIVLVSQEGETLRFRVAKNFEQLIHDLVEGLRINKDLYLRAKRLEDAYRGFLLGRDGCEAELFGASCSGVDFYEAVLEIVDRNHLSMLARNALDRYCQEVKEGVAITGSWTIECLGMALKDRELLGKIVIAYLHKVMDVLA